MENIKVDIQNNAAIITINRPQQLNALNSLMKVPCKDIRNNRQLERHNYWSWRKSFCCGADIKEFAHFDVEKEKN